MLTQVKRQRSRPVRGSRDGGATGSKTGKSCAKDKTGDELSREVANVEESFTNSGKRGRKRLVKMGDSKENDTRNY